TRADYPGATTDKDLIATAFFAHSTDLLARSAKVLGKTEDARVYRDLFERIRAAWTKEYSTASGRIPANTQTAYALAPHFGRLPPLGARRGADALWKRGVGLDDRERPHARHRARAPQRAGHGASARGATRHSHGKRPRRRHGGRRDVGDTER